MKQLSIHSYSSPERQEAREEKAKNRTGAIPLYTGNPLENVCLQ